MVNDVQNKEEMTAFVDQDLRDCQDFFAIEDSDRQDVGTTKAYERSYPLFTVGSTVSRS